jgi:hypothetical protein
LAYSLLATLVALGALEHWFMVLPVPVVDLWRWSVRAPPVVEERAPEPAAKPVLSVIPGGAAATTRPAKSAALLARQRLEDQFRQSYRERQCDLAGISTKTPSDINRMTDGRAS